ncbi:hypothetical protein DDE18_12455 [Nocardioides gansuensis]|uniref:Bacterial Ig-like domain-containing protein n=1 Tax=Nocardioides gansuensis TaxID=2138300 RepID=A0A2T8F988_9ACTN|nr:hypothetical protein [Nocardioides gansuensis]PVG82301.1 hypothetical protein DDE18_12455 [Nocardioides gansuensis]
MRTLATALVSVVTAAALAAPVTTAEAAPVSSTTINAADAARPAPIKMTTSPKAYSHYGMQGVKVTAVTGKGSRGKVTFIVNGALADKKKIKKGKASYRMSQAAAPGKYVVKAKYKTRKGKTSVRVFDSSLNVNAVEFTVSESALANDYTYDPGSLTGVVKYKDKIATEGYVDIYKDGNVKGGSSSPDYCCMASVGDNGAFEFQSYSFLERVADEYPVGDYVFKAFYTDGPEFSDYIYSQPIVVHVVP